MKIDFKDWILQHEGKKEFDKSHFYTLLMECHYESLTESDYATMFKYYPNSNDLTKRLKNFLINQDNTLNVVDRKEYILKKVQQDINEKVKLIEDEDLINALQGGFVLTHERDVVTENQLGEWHSEFISLIGDELRQFRNDNSYLLFEVYFGMTHNLQLVWYLGAPMIDKNINLDNYFDLWMMGGDYSITSGGVVVFVPTE